MGEGSWVAGEISPGTGTGSTNASVVQEGARDAQATVGVAAAANTTRVAVCLVGSSQQSTSRLSRRADLSSSRSDILHPGRPNISKDQLREKIAGLYKANKDQCSVFGLRTQFGGGKTTGFALVYDSPEAMKKFEPQYRLIRVGMATKPERASRQQRTCPHAPRNPAVARPPLTTPQASSARTDRRPSAVRPRSRVPRPRRRNKRFHSGVLVVFGGVGMALGIGSLMVASVVCIM